MYMVINLHYLYYMHTYICTERESPAEETEIPPMSVPCLFPGNWDVVLLRPNMLYTLLTPGHHNPSDYRTHHQPN